MLIHKAASGAAVEQPALKAETPTHQLALRVESLKSANTDVAHVAPTASLITAQSIMLRYDYSQLAVLSGSHTLRGAVSWESIAKARLLDGNPSLATCTQPSDPVAADEDLLGLIPRITDQGFVFVRDAQDRRIRGIVTLADVSHEFSRLAGPFFLLGEIERRLRRVVDGHFTAEELRTVASSTSRQIESADDLTLGEYVRLLQQPESWERLQWPLDRSQFIKALDEVREVRNDVMHFSPDPLGDEEVGRMSAFLRWLRLMDS
ncbi:MAG: CBS domain-containing protein [Actinomycetota bacterium]|nr:CBS domain-containing protein [Actinomycetota bacterium]